MHTALICCIVDFHTKRSSIMRIGQNFSCPISILKLTFILIATFYFFRVEVCLIAVFEA
jgi:hypothetical protein